MSDFSSVQPNKSDQVLAFDTNNLLMFLVRNESSPLAISSVAVALDFQVFLAQTIRLEKSNSNDQSAFSKFALSVISSRKRTPGRKSH